MSCPDCGGSGYIPNMSGDPVACPTCITVFNRRLVPKKPGPKINLNDVRPVAECPECKGKGEVLLLNTYVPCRTCGVSYKNTKEEVL